MDSTMAKDQEKRIIRISSKRQITIPQKFFSLLGFQTEAECVLQDGELVIRPIKELSGGEFSEQILTDLIAVRSKFDNRYKNRQTCCSISLNWRGQ